MRDSKSRSHVVGCVHLLGDEHCLGFRLVDVELIVLTPDDEVVDVDVKVRD